MNEYTYIYIFRHAVIIYTRESVILKIDPKKEGQNVQKRKSNIPNKFTA